MNKSYILFLMLLLSPGVNWAQRVLKTTPSGINLVTTGVPHNPYMTLQICLPSVLTIHPTNISFTTADSGGIVYNAGSDPGGVTARGVCWSLLPGPTISDPHTTDGLGLGVFASLISGIDLVLNTTYYVRAYATNSVGTAYGNDIAFTALPNCGILNDFDGNVYSTIMINNKCYTRESLITTHDRNGIPITLETVNANWSVLGTPAYCWYNNDEATYKVPYGALYNWYAVNTGTLCPANWHVPTLAEWQALTDYLGGANAANLLKETGILHWTFGNASTNATGFTALPGGTRYNDGSFSTNVSDFGNYWTSSSPGGSVANMAQFTYIGGSVNLLNSVDKKYGNSVKCMRNF